MAMMGDNPSAGYKEPRLDFQSNDPMSMAAGASGNGRTTAKQNFVTDDQAAERYFIKKDSIYSVKQKIEEEVMQPTDGSFQGIWVLTVIDHWNNDHEKVVVATEKSVIVVKYDFVTKRIKDQQKIMINLLKRIQVGNIVYPAKSFAKPREHGAVRLIWGEMTDMSVTQKWNPICKTIPFLTFAHHPLFYNPKETEPDYYNVDEFLNTVEQMSSRMPVQPPTVQENIEVEVYSGVTSAIFNQSFLGFSKDRNGVSF